MDSEVLLQPDTENELLALTAQGNHEAFTQIYRVYAPRIHGVALTYLEQDIDADELVQDVFIKVWNKRDKLTSVDNFKSWIFIIARNSIFDHFRRKRSDLKKHLIYSKNLQTTVEDTSDRVEDRQYTRILETALNQLPPQRKKIYELARIKGLSTAEIAQEMGISRHTVKNQLKSANQAVREYFKENLDLLLIAAIFFFRR
jgi:RNA polymerase sigma-70 factor (family 1)